MEIAQVVFILQFSLHKLLINISPPKHNRKMRSFIFYFLQGRVLSQHVIKKLETGTTTNMITTKREALPNNEQIEKYIMKFLVE